MTQRASQSLQAVLIRVGLLLALVIMLMAENAQAQAQSQQAHPLAHSISAWSQHFRTDNPTSSPLRIDDGSTRANRTA
jgi:hypothetical protein